MTPDFRDQGERSQPIQGLARERRQVRTHRAAEQRCLSGCGLVIYVLFERVRREVPMTLSRRDVLRSLGAAAGAAAWIPNAAAQTGRGAAAGAQAGRGGAQAAGQPTPPAPPMAPRDYSPGAPPV